MAGLLGEAFQCVRLPAKDRAHSQGKLSSSSHGAMVLPHICCTPRCPPAAGSRHPEAARGSFGGGSSAVVSVGLGGALTAIRIKNTSGEL